MSWEGDYWGRNGALQRARRKYKSSMHTAEDCITFASALHSGAGRALAECKRGRVAFLLIALYLGFYAVIVVSQAMRTTGVHDQFMIKYNMVDVACAVLRRWGWMIGGRKNSARRLLKWIRWNVAVDNEFQPAHTRAFLVVHALNLGLDDSANWKQRLELLAEEALAAGEQNQAGRVWKYIFKLYGDQGARERALELAGPDQRVKMGA